MPCKKLPKPGDKLVLQRFIQIYDAQIISKLSKKDLVASLTWKPV